MIVYETRRWWKVFFTLDGTIIRAVLVRALLLAGFTAALALVHTLITPIPAIDPVGHTIIGLVLGFLIVFRTNTSYDRYWEARRLWGGVVNASRSLVRTAAVHAPADDRPVRLVAAFAIALRQHLRGEKDISEIEPLVPADLYQRAVAANNPPTIVAVGLSEWVVAMKKDGTLDTIAAGHLEKLVTDMSDAQGGCERILRTPIPFVYAALIKHLIAPYLFTLPVVLVPKMGWGAVFAIALAAFALLGVEEAGLEVEDPFGEDPNDLPLERLCATVAGDAQAIRAAATPDRALVGRAD